MPTFKRFSSLALLHAWMTRGNTAPCHTALRESSLLTSKAQKQLVLSNETDRSQLKAWWLLNTKQHVWGYNMLLSDISRSFFALNRLLPLQMDMGQVMLPTVGCGAKISTCSLGLCCGPRPLLFPVPHTWQDMPSLLSTLSTAHQLLLPSWLPSSEKGKVGDRTAGSFLGLLPNYGWTDRTGPRL